MVKFLFTLLFMSLMCTAFIYVLFNGRISWLMDRARRKGAVKGPPTMFHVRDLLVRQEKEKAIQLYCQIFNIGRKEAKKAVD